MIGHVYPSGLIAMMSGLNLTSAPIRATLVEGYTYNDAHDRLNDVSAYSIGSSVLLTGIIVPGDGGFYAAMPLVFPTIASGHTINGVIFYHSTGVSSTSELLSLSGSYAAGSVPLEIITDGTNVTLDWGSNPIFTI